MTSKDHKRKTEKKTKKTKPKRKAGQLKKEKSWGVRFRMMMSNMIFTRTYKQATWSSFTEEAHTWRALAGSQTTTNTLILSTSITQCRSNRWGYLPFHILPLPCLHTVLHLVTCEEFYVHCRARRILSSEKVTENPACSTLFLMYSIHGATIGIADLHHPPPPSRMRAEPEFSTFNKGIHPSFQGEITDGARHPVFDKRGGRSPATQHSFGGAQRLFWKY